MNFILIPIVVLGWAFALKFLCSHKGTDLVEYGVLLPFMLFGLASDPETAKAVLGMCAVWWALRLLFKLVP